MPKSKAFLGLLLTVSLAAGASALLLEPAQATPGACVQRPLPPALQQACRGCLDVWAPVLCTIRCAGGTEERVFSNQCYANCSGYIIVGDCVYIGP